MKKPVSVNLRLVGKPDKQTLALNQGKLTKLKLDSVGLLQMIKQGYAFAPVFDGARKKANFRVGGYAALDFDDWFLDEALKSDFIKQHSSFIYTTPSHTPEKHRFRAVFELEEPREDVAGFEHILRGLCREVMTADWACVDCSRMFFGSKNCESWFFGKVLSNRVVNNLINREINIRKAEDEARRKRLENMPKMDNVDFDEARKMLQFVDKSPGYHLWRNIVWALHSQFGHDAKYLVEEWSPDDQNGRFIDTLMRTNRGEFNIGTVVYHAKQGGYKK